MADAKSDAKKKPAGPSTLALVVEAVKAVEDRKGASIQSIKAHILQKYPDKTPEMLKAQLKRAVLRGLETGVLVRPARDAAATGLTGRLKVNKAKEEKKPKKEKAGKVEKTKSAKTTKTPKTPKKPLKKPTGSPKKAAAKKATAVKKTPAKAKPKTPTKKVASKTKPKTTPKVKKAKTTPKAGSSKAKK